MEVRDYFSYLTDEIHSTVAATVDESGLPVTCVIDIMDWDDHGIYFLTAKGKSFYRRLTKKNFLSVTGMKGTDTLSCRSLTLRGTVRELGQAPLPRLFEKNPYMQSIYPGDTRSALEVFCLYEAEGEYFDISDPSHIMRDSISIGQAAHAASGYYVGKNCIGCKLCYSVCPQKCIDISVKPVIIDRHHCLHCGRCAEVCPCQAIERRF